MTIQPISNKNQVIRGCNVHLHTKEVLQDIVSMNDINWKREEYIDSSGNRMIRMTRR